MEVEVHPGDEYLSSLEPQSLQVLTYIKFTNVPNSSTVTPSGWRSVWGSCPVLRDDSSNTVSGAEDIISYLKKQGYDLDEHLKESQKNEIVAYSALLTNRLLPAILYSRWLDSQNYLEFTRNLYAKLLHFPFTLFYLSWQYHSVQHLIMRGAPLEITIEQRGMELLNKAEECIGLLSARLGDSDYFFGSNPSSLDAVMFGYLEVILQTPLPSNNSLYNKLASCANLSKFCKKIRADHFPDKKTRVAPAMSTAQEPSSPPTTVWRDPTFWLSVGVAAVVLGVQGMRVGLFDRWITTHNSGVRLNTNNTLENKDSDK